MGYTAKDEGIIYIGPEMLRHDHFNDLRRKDTGQERYGDRP